MQDLQKNNESGIIKLYMGMKSEHWELNINYSTYYAAIGK